MRLLLNTDCITETGCERGKFGVAMGGCAFESFKMEEIHSGVLNATVKDPVENRRLSSEKMIVDSVRI